MIGRPQEAVRSGRESRTAARELGDKDFYLADLHGLVLALLEVGEYEEALSVARTGVQAARSLGSSERLHPSLLLLGDASRVLFRLEEARATYTEMTGSVNIPQQHALTHSKLCAVAALEGDWEEAHTHALEAARLRGEVVLQLTAPLHFYYEVEALVRGGDDRDLAYEELSRFAEHAGENRRLQVAYLRSRAVLERWGGYRASAGSRGVGRGDGSTRRTLADTGEPVRAVRADWGPRRGSSGFLRGGGGSAATGCEDPGQRTPRRFPFRAAGAACAGALTESEGSPPVVSAGSSAGRLAAGMLVTVFGKGSARKEVLSCLRGPIRVK